MSDEYIWKFREIIDNCRLLAARIDPHPSAKALRDVADRLELNFVVLDEDRRAAGDYGATGGQIGPIANS